MSSGHILPTLLLLSALSVSPAADRFPRTDFRQPDFFPILNWDPLHGWDGKTRDCETNGLESLKECHFNIGGFVQARDLGQCKKLGLGAIYLPEEPPIPALTYQSQWKTLSDAEIERRIKAMLKAGGSNPALKGYFIMDEPSASDFPALGKAVAALRKYAPDKFAYINLFPDYAIPGSAPSSQLGTATYTEYLERFVTEVKPPFLSYDNYRVEYSRDLQDRGIAASYFQNLIEVRRVGLKYNLPCLQIVSSNQLQPSQTTPTPANLALQAYTTLAAGFRGVTWYTYYARGYQYSPIGPDGNKTLTWAYLSEINRQVAALAPVLSQLTSSGVYFTAPPIADGLPLLPGKLVESISCASPVMVGEFSGSRGESFFMLVNLNLERSANLSWKLKTPNASLKMVSPLDGKIEPLPVTKDGLWLAPGQGVLLQVGP